MDMKEINPEEKKIYVLNHHKTIKNLDICSYGSFSFYLFEDLPGGDIKAIILYVKKRRYFNIDDDKFKGHYYTYKIIHKFFNDGRYIHIPKAEYEEYKEAGQITEYNKDIIYIDLVTQFPGEILTPYDIEILNDDILCYYPYDKFFKEEYKKVHDIQYIKYDEDKKICLTCGKELKDIKSFKTHEKTKTHILKYDKYKNINLNDEKETYIYIRGKYIAFYNSTI